MRAKKSYGQHFLVNESIAADIAAGLEMVDGCNTVVEVGPGKGMLTKYLMNQDYKLLAIEADRDMATYLHEHYPDLEGKIIREDFLKVDLRKVLGEEPFAIIGNFPYNISSQILFKMLEYKELVPELVGMFQKEVGMRVAAPHGSKVYGVISVLIQAYYEPFFLMDVDKSEFDPPPKVQSVVIRLKRKASQDLGCDHKLFRSVVKLAFSQRRKMLRNTMKSFVKGNEMLQEDFFRQRPEQLSVEDFVQLTNRIAANLPEDD